MVYDLGIIKRQRYVEPTFIGTGGTVTTATSNSIAYVYHTFTANSVFVPVYNVNAECLIVAGGGAGSDIAGGGAGGFRSLTINFQKNNAFAITVGQGGTTATIAGYNSSIIGNNVSYTANGGGAGGQTGGSGGGGTGTPGSGAAGNTPATSPSQGNDGGDSSGGGAGGAGSGTVGGSGRNWLNGTAYAGGGSGGGGASSGGGNNSVGTPNTGGGGSIGNFAGGSGIVIIRYKKYQASVPAAFDASFAYTSLLLSNQSTVDFSTGVVNMLVIGGGGGGGKGNSGTGTAYYGGSGGAGGLYVNSFSPTGSTTFVVTVGAGGAGSTSVSGTGTPGTSSTIRGKIVGDATQTITATGGGGGRSYTNTGAVPADASGGSGGGATNTALAGVSTLSENDGPNYFGHSGYATVATGRPFAGGGGAGGAGTGSAGGPGKYISIANSSTFSTTFAAGGGDNVSGTIGGNGGGAGGGPSGTPNYDGFNGGAGLVFFWHLTTASVAVVGGTGAYTVSVQNGYTIYAFINGSGTITLGPKWGNDYLKDAGAASYPVQAYGNVLAQGSFNPYSTNWSTYLNGTTDYLSIQHSDAFNISSDFTLEGWFYSTRASTSTIITKSITAENSPFKIKISAQNTLTTVIGIPTQQSTTVEYLVVAGGGGGGGGDVGTYAASGGGGAGGYLSGTLSIVQGTTYSVTVGAGGSDGAFSSSSGTVPTSGSNSAFSTITAIGGGYGGHQGIQGTSVADGAVGGSGGGGASGTSSAGGSVGSAGTVGQGNAGGDAVSYCAGGGGGAGAAGGNGVAVTSAGNGGAGKQWLDGNYYAGGGGGAARGSYTQGTGGIGGGSAGLATGNASDATANTGGGGGGVGGGVAGNSAGNGGSGIVIVRWPDSFAAASGTTGSPTVTISGGYRYYIWKTSGTFSITIAAQTFPDISNTQFNLNTWNHVSVSRQGTTYTSTLNGGNLVTVANTGTIYNNTQSIYIGYDGTNYFQGFISNVRLLNGTGINALPKLPFPLIDNTTLLVSASRSVIDKSNYNFTVSQNGTPAIRRFSPFVNSGPYNTLISGGSVYFDGSTDFLTVNPVAVDFQNNSFNIEFWFYPEPIATTAYFIDSRYNTAGAMTFGSATTSTNDGMSLALQTSGLCTVSLGTSTTLISTNLENLRVKFRAWNHIAVVRNNTMLTLYINGNYAGSTSTSVTITTVTTSSYAALSAYTTLVDYLVVAGGGGGGGSGGGGGGAGGFRTATGFAVAANTLFTITVGAGGTGGATNVRGNVGLDSVFSTITATGGGYGGTGSSSGTMTGGNGGSGGGGGYYGDGTFGSTAGGQSSPVTSPVQGYAGGAGDTSNNFGGGGGGAGAVGSGGSGSTGTGGIGVQSAITGTNTYYAGGGGGWGRSATPAGGLGGGGAGSNYGTSTSPVNGTTGTGGGGGAGNISAAGGNGGYGIVILRHLSSYSSATTVGATITSSGGYTIYTWTSSGSITFPVRSAALTTNNFGIGRSSYLNSGYYKGYLSNLNILKGTISNRAISTAGTLGNTIEYLIVGGGGGGGGSAGSGGGAGGFRYGSFVTTQLGATYNITVGSGGGTAVKGGDSSMIGSGINITSAGGGAASAGNVAGSGGSGSGNYGTGNTPSTSPPQGNDGGLGGGGGAGSAGSGFNGGTGSTSTITGSELMYAGGGGGNNTTGVLTGGNGGAGGGGAGWATLTFEYLVVAGGGAGGASTGGGGGGGGFLTSNFISTLTGATYVITVGGAGTNSSIVGGGFNILAYAGGAGGAGGTTGSSGGSGGGANGAVIVVGQGNPGGSSGGGGGASAAGGYDGGSGRQSNIDGLNYYYSGGGGKASSGGTGGNGGSGGGGGGTGFTFGSAGGGGRSAGATFSHGGTNTGGGGSSGQPGGSGIIIIRYAGTQVCTGGSVSTVGTYTVHTFLSGGALVENVTGDATRLGTAGIRGSGANGGTNTGGGGGGGGSGGSGIVAIRYLGQPRGFGGNITTNVYGLYTVHTFLASDTYVDSQLTYILPYAPVTIASTNTSLLINATESKIFDATTQNNVYQIGDVSVSNSVVKYNPTSMYFDGDGDGLGIGGSTSTTTATNLTVLGLGDFTVEMWMYPLSLYNTATAPGLLDSRTTSTSVPGSAYLGYTGVTLTDGSQIGWKDDTLFVTTGTVIINTWNYVSMVRAGSTLTMYVNGAATSSTTNTTNYTIPFKYIGISYNLLSFKGYIDDLRITQTARADVFPLSYPQLK